ncbi:beta-galactosidase 7-like [Cucurbita maxima]|uniref:Beta-galactosidase n=1 Tax=Cucurbita maxima TaxID=3661 RepID=A0A6J1I6P5_CUCMA|nr:beta-galactosidase 7-like [Cucurbita maxima]
MWPLLIDKAKQGGIDAIETYVFWNAHEPQQGQYDFSGNNDRVRFIRTIQEQGLYAILRIGPYVCAEWNYGGFPVWLHNLPGIEFRTKNKVFMDEMEKFSTLIINMMKEYELFASQGGPIIIAQIENEYGNIKGSYGQAGNEYVKWCADLALSYNLSIPWIMCQEDDAPQPIINTCNGFYCDQFKPNSKNSPKMWTENWTGWFKAWGSRDPLRTAEDLAFAVARFFQYGGTLQNYYMYHGGTNFGRTSGGPYITTSYDYNAPLDEYGNTAEPKWGHLKQLHDLVKSMEEVLTYGEVNHTEYGHLTTATSYTYKGKSSCFFGNAENGDRDITYGNRTYKVRGWSVSILPDCKTEVYNTAEVNTQTTIREKVSSQVGNFKEPMQWQWRDEKIEFVSREGEVTDCAMTANRLLDQKVLTNDSSDYLWYITSFHLSGSDPLFGKNVTLRVKTSGHILHAFLNGRHIGSQHAQKDKYSFVFEKKISDLLYGFNQISLLSATVGLANYGAHFENSEVGVHGPVELIADGETIRNLSSNEWYYKVGLDGEKSEFFNPNCQLREPWNYGNLPLNQNFVWYKTTFQTPSGSEAVIVDLMGMGKGHAWVNGLSIGRYWPSYLSIENGCSSSCDFRGAYSDGKCATNCGKPTQRWYHIPRSYLNCEGENTLILFEEFGGMPLDIDIQTTRVKKVCAMPYAGSTLELSCHDRTISDIKFVSFGNPHGTCDSFQKGSCESSTALSVIEEACVGQRECSIEVSEKNLGPTGCKKPNRLAVQVTC